MAAAGVLRSPTGEKVRQGARPEAMRQEDHWLRAVTQKVTAAVAGLRVKVGSR